MLSLPLSTRDRSSSGIQFNSHLLPPYLRRTKSIEELIPWLYLKGLSTDFCIMYFMEIILNITAQAACILHYKNHSQITEAHVEQLILCLQALISIKCAILQ